MPHFDGYQAEVQKISCLKVRVTVFPGKLQAFPGECCCLRQLVSIDLNDGFGPEDLALQLGVACLRKTLRLLQLFIGLRLLAEPGVCQRAEQISFNREIAHYRIGHPGTVKQAEHFRPAALISKDVRFKETKLHGPIAIPGGKIPPGLFCLLLSLVEVSVQKIAANVLKGRCGVRSRGH